MRRLTLMMWFVLSIILVKGQTLPVIDTLQLWLRSDSVELQPGSSVSKIYDCSGHGWDAEQTSVASRPAYNTIDSDINNYPSIVFDGSNDYFEGSGLLGSMTDYTVFCVVKIDLFKNYNWIYHNAPLGTVSSFGVSVNSAGLVRFFDGGSLFADAISPLDISEFYILSVQHSNDSTPKTAMFQNGFNDGMATFNTTDHQDSGYLIGRYPGGTHYLNGDFAELIIYDSYLSDNERYLVENYLRCKYFPTLCQQPVDLGVDIVVPYGLCDTLLDASDQYEQYLWNTGDTTQSIIVSTSNVGSYWVEVIDTFGYKSSDTINVDFPGNLSPFSVTSICYGDTIIWNTLLDTSFYNITWQNSSPLSQMAISQTGSYYVSITDTNSCSFSSDTVLVVVDSFPVLASLGPDDSLCAGNAIGLLQGAAQAETYLWCNGSSNSEILLISTGMYCLAVTDTIGCVAEDSVFITIKGQSPIASFYIDTTCFGEISSFTDSSTVVSPYIIVNWAWDFGDGQSSTDQNPSHQYSNYGSYNVSLTVETDSGCFDDTVITIDVHPLPNAGFSPLVFLENLSTGLVDQSTISSGFIDSWLWVFDVLDTMTAQNPSYTFTNLGIHNVTLAVQSNFGCSDTIMQLVEVELSPLSFDTLQLWLRSDSVELQTGSSVSKIYDCSGHGWDAEQISAVSRPIYNPVDSVINNYPSITFDGSDDYFEGTGLLGSMTDYTVFCVVKIDFFKNFNWIYHNAPLGTVSSFGVSVNSAGLVRFFDGGSVFTDAISPLDISEFYILSAQHSNDSTPKTAMFQNGFNDGMATFNTTNHQDSGYLIGRYPGSTHYLNGDLAELIIYDSYLSDNERYLVENYLRNKYAPPVNLGPNIELNYFCDTVLIAGDRYLSYLWSNGDTSNTITVKEPGQYWVAVTDIFGYVSSDTIEVNYPGNLMGINGTYRLCIEDTLILDTQLDTSIYSLVWSDNSADSIININEAGDYYVSITDAFGCVFNSDTITVIIDSFPIIASLGPDDSLCLGNSIGLVQGVAQVETYLWCNGSTNSEILPTSTGMYCLAVIDTNGCIAQDSINITIEGIAPISSIYMDTTCHGEFAAFSDSSSVDLSQIIGWSWDFGDGQSSTDQNPSHQYSNYGSYNVSLTVETDSGCFDDTTVAIEVHPLPIAGFSPILTCTNNDTEFMDQSTVASGSIVNWLWIIDGLNSMTDENPNYLFVDSGLHDVRLSVITDFGCADTIADTLFAKSGPMPGFTHSLSCGSNFVSFTDTSLVQSPHSIMDYYWDVDNNGYYQDGSFAHNFSDIGSYDVSLTVQSTNGCISTISKTIDVNPVSVSADFVNTDPCLNIEYQFIDSSTAINDAIVAWYWAFDNLGVAYEQNSKFVFTEPLVYPVMLVAITSSGCKDTIRKDVTVHPLPESSFDFNPKFGVQTGDLINFENNTTGAASYSWDFGDNSSDTAFNVSHGYLDTGIYQVTLHAFDEFGCMDSLTLPIDVRPPSIDVDVSATYADCQSDFIENIQVTLINQGTREITSLDLYVRVEGVSPVREYWTGFIEPSKSLTHTFTVSFPSEIGVNYWCVSVESPNGVNDQNISNNEICKACTKDFSLIDPFPNPANSEINFWFILPQIDDVKAEVLDAKGSYMGTVLDGKGEKGLNQFVFNTSSMPKGVYTLKFTYFDTVYYKLFVIQ